MVALTTLKVWEVNVVLGGGDKSSQEQDLERFSKLARTLKREGTLANPEQESRTAQ